MNTVWTLVLITYSVFNSNGQQFDIKPVGYYNSLNDCSIARNYKTQRPNMIYRCVPIRDAVRKHEVERRSNRPEHSYDFHWEFKFGN